MSISNSYQQVKFTYQHHVKWTYQYQQVKWRYILTDWGSVTSQSWRKTRANKKAHNSGSPILRTSNPDLPPIVVHCLILLPHPCYYDPIHVIMTPTMLLWPQPTQQTSIKNDKNERKYTWRDVVERWLGGYLMRVHEIVVVRREGHLKGAYIIVVVRGVTYRPQRDFSYQPAPLDRI